MKHFKLPLIVTGIVFSLMVVVGIVSIIWINSLDVSNREKEKRAGMLGSGVATMGLVVMAPFWFYSAAKVGKEKREQREKKKGR